jgi:hypothetical protein
MVQPLPENVHHTIVVAGLWVLIHLTAGNTWRVMLQRNILIGRDLGTEVSVARFS